MEKKLSFIITGLFGLCLQLLTAVFIVYWMTDSFTQMVAGDVFSILISISALFIFFSMFGGYMVIGINEAKIISFMGKYKGTIKNNGWYYKNPFYNSSLINLAIINVKTSLIEVNEKSGVPIQISVVISYKVIDTYKVSYVLSDTGNYISNQFNASLREFAKSHTYQQLAEIDHNFIEQLNKSVEQAGIEVLDAKITQLNYVESIASSMLQKQQAQSLSDARETIVNNALLIAQQTADKIGFTYAEHKERFVSDLIIVLCSHSPVTPTINVGGKN